MNLSCKNLKFSYDSHNLIQVSQFTLASNTGITWIRGSSGSGKSTFLSLLAGLHAPKEGEISWGDFPFSKRDEQARNQFRFQHIGYVPQENKMINHWTVEQNLKLISTDEKLISEYLKLLQFDKASREKKIEVLSGGERQRINLIKTFLKKPRIALLDEPTAHLDDKNVGIVIDLLKEKFRESLVIIVSHDSRLEKLLLNFTDFAEINR
ncbi:MAG: ABC transporter ATP-binding protein [Pseudobdellovibrionaceae bacterium]